MGAAGFEPALACKAAPPATNAAPNRSFEPTPSQPSCGILQAQAGVGSDHEGSCAATGGRRSVLEIERIPAKDGRRGSRGLSDAWRTLLLAFVLAAVGAPASAHA